MFTVNDIRNIAVQLEKNGEEVYLKLSKKAQDPELAILLTTMAEEEKYHGEWFSTFKSEKVLSPEQLEMEAVGRSLLQDMIKGNNFLLDEKSLEQADTIDKILAQSKKFEAETILFYEFISGLVDDDEVRKKIELIIEEEKKHIQIIERMEKSFDSLQESFVSST